ncbi:dephospho-CoA kinase [Corynebacterium aquilae]|uniref:Dephospho-CoA kinase n=1 Tax=Corynebacterium aquilae DSM 44791 TaxID=1431546 RepID=A0A1L7CFL4_9CORY|nr:dephospho-CoA kinase [Corynebacterium aquilae]APT84660.1 dephospho-CoA kinase [Corynebacterium aquilae DSM 44791]
MKLIGLTGGIGSGKTTVATHLKHHGLPIVDADKIARDIVQPQSPLLPKLAAEFGADIIDDHGALNRKLLAQRAFSSDERTAALNAIMHPAIREETQRRFDEAKAQGHAAVVYDMPLLVDLGLHTDMDLVIVVDVEPEKRVTRLVEHRGLDETDAWARIKQQIPDDKRRAAADIIIDNNGTREQLSTQLDTLITTLRTKGIPLA